MQVRDGMSSVVLTVNPGHSLRDAANAMAERRVGAAVVIDPEQPGPGIITERDILLSVGSGRGSRPGARGGPPLVQAHLRRTGLVARGAAEAMVRGGFRHLVVVDGGEMVGILSMRDIVRCWVSDGATSELPSDLGAVRWRGLVL